MSFPPPIIPQTVEQALARDQQAGVPPRPLDDPRAELERLRQAIRDHRLEVGEGATGADFELWAHIGETA